MKNLLLNLTLFFIISINSFAQITSDIEAGERIILIMPVPQDADSVMFNLTGTAKISNVNIAYYQDFGKVTSFFNTVKVIPGEYPRICKLYKSHYRWFDNFCVQVVAETAGTFTLKLEY